MKDNLIGQKFINIKGEEYIVIDKDENFYIVEFTKTKHKKQSTKIGIINKLVTDRLYIGQEFGEGEDKYVVVCKADNKDKHIIEFLDTHNRYTVYGFRIGKNIIDKKKKMGKIRNSTNGEYRIIDHKNHIIQFEDTKYTKKYNSDSSLYSTILLKIDLNLQFMALVFLVKK